MFKTLGALRDSLLDLQYQDQQALTFRKPLELVCMSQLVVASALTGGWTKQGMSLIKLLDCRHLPT